MREASKTWLQRLRNPSLSTNSEAFSEVGQKPKSFGGMCYGFKGFLDRLFFFFPPDGLLWLGFFVFEFLTRQAGTVFVFL